MTSCTHPHLCHPMGPFQTALYACVIIVGFMLESFLRKRRSRIISVRIASWQRGEPTPWKL